MRDKAWMWISVGVLGLLLLDGSLHARSMRQQATRAVLAASCTGNQLDLDLDGDGSPEEVVVERVGGDAWATVYSDGDLRSTSRIGQWRDDAALEAIDANGDGRTDLVRRWSDGGKQVAQVWLSNGASFDAGWTGATALTCLAQR